MPLKLQKIRAYLLLLFPVILLAVISPVGVGIAHAGFWDVISSVFSGAGNTIAYVIATTVNYLFYIPSSWALRAAAFVFDTVVPYSLGVVLPGQSSAFQSTFITEGWGLMRDITNMVFIFAMLYIAIATILQVGAGRNTKALIINIILIALFVNFSLFLAQVVIDAANLLAFEFYKALSASPQGLAAIFLTGFNPQQLLGTPSFESWVALYNQNNSVLIAMYLFGGVVQFIAAYMILLASFLFIGRIVVLWILMIVSPIAFAAYIIPKFAGKFTEWWDRLLKQAFVAPIFLFFFYILALFIQGGLKTFLAETATQVAGQDKVIQAIFKVSLGFSLVVAFMVVALRMTKSLSGEVAGYATKAVGFTLGAAAAAVTGPVGAARLAKLAGTFHIPTEGMTGGAQVGRVVGAPLAPIREKVYGKGREIGGEAAKKVAEAGRKPGIGGKLLRGFGIASVAGGLEAAAKGGAKADIEKAKKNFGDLSENALLTKYGLPTTSAEVRTGIIELLGAKKKLGRDKEGKWRIDPADIKKTLETVKERGYDTEKEIEDKYLWQYAEKPEELTKAARTMSVDAFKEIAKERTKDEKTGEKTVPSKFFDNPEVFKVLMQNVTAGHLNTLADPETNKNFADNFLGQLKKAVEEAGRERLKKLQEEAKTKEKPMNAEAIKEFVYTVNDYFKEKDINNARGGQWAGTTQGKGQLDTADIPYKEESPKKTKEDTEKEKAEREKKEKEAEEERAKKEKEKFNNEYFGGGENTT